ncbi:MAG: hypothetical protein V1843_04460 [bacterium]
MKKLIIFVILLLFSSISYAASVNIVQFVVNPTANFYISDLETNPSMFSITLQNSTQNRQSVILALSIIDSSSRVVLSGETDPSAFPIELSAGETKSMINTDFKFATMKHVTYDRDLDAQIRRTNRVPAGIYTLTLTCYTGYMGSPDSDTATQVVTITNPSAPILIYPVSLDIPSTDIMPSFTWSLTNIAAGVQTKFNFTIWEKGEGMNMDQTVGGQPMWEAKSIMESRYDYPASAETLKAGKTYYWQIQAFDSYNTPIGDNNGKSEIAEFNVLAYSTELQADLEEINKAFQNIFKEKGITSLLRGYVLEAASFSDGTPVTPEFLQKLQQGKIEVLKVEVR